MNDGERSADMVRDRPPLVTLLLLTLLRPNGGVVREKDHRRRLKPPSLWCEQWSPLPCELAACGVWNRDR
jgi:hypothetical protein